MSLAYLGTDPGHIEIRVAGLPERSGKTPRLKVVDADSTWESPPRIPAAAGPGGWLINAQGPGLYTLDWP